MREQFLQKIYPFIEEYQMIRAGDTVLAGVSGGADSMCLLAVLMAYRAQVDFTLRIVHVEHGIRGAESLADAVYVADFCDERGLPCAVVHVDAPAYARAHGCSVEEAARELRYRAFTQAAEEACAARVRIAVAHHSEDQAETVLWQAIRGSSLRGLGGMRPVRDNIIRPLLMATRGEIEQYLQEEGIVWREDRTNADRTYTRNRMRGEVLTVLTDMNTAAIRHLCGSAVQLWEAEDYLAEQTVLLYARYVKEQEGQCLIGDTLGQEAPLMQRRVIYLALQRTAGVSKDLAAVHVQEVRELFARQTGRSCTLPYDITAKRVYEGVRLWRGERQDIAPAGDLTDAGVRLALIEAPADAQISKKKYTKWFDYDKIEHHVQIRRRQSGDYLTVDAEGHRQSLKKYLINEKIPADERDSLLLLADGSHIMWVIGHRISEHYKVRTDTARILQVQYDGGNENE